MELTKEQLENGLKYEIDLSRKLKNELKRIEEELKKCQERMVNYNRELNNSKRNSNKRGNDMKKNKKIEGLLDRWEEGNMSVQDLSDELYILFAVSNRRELLIAYELRACKFPVQKKYYDEAERRVDEYLSN